MMQAAQQLTGLEKASVLMLSLSSAQSSKVFDQLTPEERGILSAQIAQIRHVDTITRQQVLEEVNSIVRKNTLREIVSKERRAAVQSNVPLKWLEDLDPEAVAKMIATERSTNVALVVAHLTPKVAAEVLGYLDEKLRNEVVKCLASIKTVSNEVIEAVDMALRKKASDAQNAKETPPGAPDTLIGMLSKATGHARASMLGALTHKAQPVSSIVAKPFSTLEDLTLLSDIDLGVVLSETQIDDWRIVLSVASGDLKDMVLRNLSFDARERIECELQNSPRVKLSELESAQQRIVGIARELEVKGRIFGVCPAQEAVVE